MKQIKLLIAIGIFASILFTSCAEEQIGDAAEVENITLNVPITKGTNGEDNIKSARIMIFNSTGNNLLLNKYKDGDDISFIELVPVGQLNVYLIANEIPSWDLDNVTTTAQLKSKILSFSAYPVVNAANTIPMIGQYESLRINSDGTMIHKGNPLNLSTGGTVEKLYAKVTLDLNCYYKDLPGNSPTITNTIELESVSIKRMPKTSWLTQRHHTETDDSFFFNGAEASLANVVYDLTNPDPNKRGFRGEFEFYIPEYLLTHVDKYCYVSINTRLRENPTMKMRYKLVIGNGINTKSSSEMNSNGVTQQDLRITRNTKYEFVVTTIKSFGEYDGLEVFQGAKPWDPENVDNDITGRIINVSAIERTVTDIVPTRIYFTSNQPEVFVEPIGYVGLGSETFTVNNFFWQIAGTAPALNFHYNYNAALKSGEGYIDIHTTENIQNNYLHRIILNAGGLKREIKIHTDIPAAPPEWATHPYIGTFHKKDEVGERVIYSQHKGTWSARVVNEGEDFVLLSRTKSKDNKIKTDNPGDAELYPVTDGVKSVDGIGRIYFRVGMRDKKLTSGNRYARIEIKYNNKALTRYIYVRHGEDDDYVMRPTNPVNSGGMNRPNRPLAKRFKAYNLTAPLSAASPIINLGRNYTFTDYPTKAGYLFMFHSTEAIDASTSDISLVNPALSTAWKQEWESCPVGYRRPTNGSFATSINVKPATSTSEIRQSLYLNPPGTADLESNDDNNIWGYYADGYFDRRPIHSSPFAGTSNTCVGSGANDIAYIGSLFYNPYTFESLFFPAAGFRTSGVDEYNKNPKEAGTRAVFWSKTSGHTTGGGWMMSMRTEPVQIALNTGYRKEACSIRCIIDE